MNRLKIPSLLAICCVTLLFACWLPGGTAQAQLRAEPKQLIVLLSAYAGAPTADEVTEAISRRSLLPGQLGAGAPLSAYPLLPHRADGKLGDWLAAHPDHPRARLERYVVFSYGPEANLAAIRQQLSRDINVSAVGENASMEFSAIPSDPFFPNNGIPATYQWGLHLMNFPAAWDWTTGHGYVAAADNGVQVNYDGDFHAIDGHPDLRDFQVSGSSVTYSGGNFRAALSHDFGRTSCPNDPPSEPNVDEMQAEWADNNSCAGVAYPLYAGHGTHVAGIIAATSNNSQGVAGSSWHSSLMMGKTSHLKFNNQFQLGASVESSLADQAAALTWLIDSGAQAINMSFGSRPSTFGDCTSVPINQAISALCDAIEYADLKDVLMVAASGNRKNAEIQFPARDQRVVAVGGLMYPGVFWDEGTSCPQGQDGCGSTWGPEQELAAPAKSVQSTFYYAMEWNPTCKDGSNADGYGECTGTSMAAPHVTGLAGLVRSANPRLSTDQIRDLLKSRASQANSWNQYLGWGIPDAAASVEGALGSTAGLVIKARPIPLFGFYSSAVTDHLFTTVPQMATGALMNGAAYSSAATVVVAPAVAGYSSFPGASCAGSGCNAQVPRAALYILSTDKSPHPDAPTLVPLFRMVKKFSSGGNPFHVDHFYGALESELVAKRGEGYDLLGVEGYLYPTCNPSDPCDATCAVAGSVAVARRYHPTRGDHAIFPIDQLASWTAAGYSQTVHGKACIGFAYSNVDSDADQLINGFEFLVGTGTSTADSDCDGTSDGVELNTYSLVSHAYGDPVSFPSSCGTTIFNDGFESGSFAAWSANTQSGGGTLSVTNVAPLEGTYHLRALVNGAAAAKAFVRDNSPAAERRYHTRFLLNTNGLTMPDGAKHYLFSAHNPVGAVILRLQLRQQGALRQIHLQSYLDDATSVNTNWITISGSTEIEIDWSASTGTDDGFTKLWVNGVLQGDLTGLDSDGLRVDYLQLGAVLGVDAGTTGEHQFDGFLSWR